MTFDEFNRFCRELTATTYVVQWNQSHVWKVGGKVFAIGSTTKTERLDLALKLQSKTLPFCVMWMVINLRLILLAEV